MGGLKFRPSMKIARVPRYPESEPLPLPKYQSDDAAGMDLHADISPDGNLTIPAGEVRLVPTGLKVEIPDGFEGQIRPRSGLATKKLLTVANSPGTVDRDFRGELIVALVNLSGDYKHITRGERVAQLVIAPVVQVNPILVDESALSPTKRGEGGFGSTGTK
jgi:dUTP pyrophosphatase